MNQIKILAFDLMGVILTEKDNNDPVFNDFDRHFDSDQIFYPWVKEEYDLDPAQADEKALEIMKQNYLVRDQTIFDLSKDYIFAEASNHLAVINQYLESIGILKYFSHIINSSEIGVCKPDPEFFKILITKVKESPENILFIDDKPENIESAQSVGLNTFNFNRNHDQYNLREQVEQELLKYQL